MQSPAVLEIVQEQAAEPPLVVVGAGPVGQRFVEESLRLAPQRHILVFSAEAWQPYDRVKLSQLLAHEISEQAIYTPIPTAPNLVVSHHNPVIEIDRERRRVRDKRGQWHRYSHLVLALGAAPFVPGIAGIDARNVFTFRDLSDTRALAARNLRSRHTVVIGGGLLGLEAARAMQRNATVVTIVQMGHHLMNQQLDDGAGELLLAQVMRLGLRVRCNARAARIMTTVASGESLPAATGVCLDSGEVLECDTVIVAAGIRPRTELALQANLAVGRGIRVDEHLRTSDPAIYAIGECIQYGEQLYGLVAPGWEHASVAAHHIAGEDARYRGSINAASLKVMGLQVCSMGDIDDQVQPSLRRHVYRDPSRGIYRAIFVVNKRLVGALAIGAWPEQPRVRAHLTERRQLQFWHVQRFVRSGDLWPEATDESVANWPAGMVVCNCTGVTRGQLTAALAQGCDKVETLAACTRASMVCGSCKPLLARFLAAGAPVQALPVARALLAICGISLGALVALLIKGAWPLATSAAARGLDWLWRDAMAKQVSGYTLLALSTLALLLSLSKRWKPFARLGSFRGWRIVHTVLGLGAIVGVVVHTGMRTGFNLNAWLMLDFLLLLGVGALAGAWIGIEPRLTPRQGRIGRRWLTWSHTWLFWPLPTLLAYHVLSVYWF